MKRILPFKGVPWAAQITDEKVRRAIMALSEWAENVRIEVENMAERLKPKTMPLGDLATTYNAVTTSATSPVYKAEDWESTLWNLYVTKANAPTLITFQLQTSGDGSNWHDSVSDDAVEIVAAASMPTRVSMSLRHPGGLFRLKATATGTDAVNTITVADGGSYRAPRQ